MNDQIKALNTYFWNVGNDIADIRLLAEGALHCSRVMPSLCTDWA